MRQWGLAGLVALTLSGMAGMAHAQSSYVRGALDRLDALEDYARYSSSLAFEVRRVFAGQQFYSSFVPATGGVVWVAAACDTDCGRMQIRVVDFQNRPVGIEHASVGASTLFFNPQAGQTYRVYAQPTDCGAAYCYVVVGAWQ
ncbi:MAG: hypothetical protein ACOH1E_10935 [Brevundimonas sp.]